VWEGTSLSFAKSRNDPPEAGNVPDMGPRLRLGETATAEGPRREREGEAGVTYAEAEATQATHALSRDEERTMAGAGGGVSRLASHQNVGAVFYILNCVVNLK